MAVTIRMKRRGRAAVEAEAAPKMGKTGRRQEGSASIEALTLEHNEGEKVNVGYSTRGVNWCGHWSMGGLTGGIPQRGSRVGM